MWLKDKNQKLEGYILRDKLNLDVISVQCAVDSRGWLLVNIKTQTKHRSNEILKTLMGEEAFKAMKQPAAMAIPILDYNRCAPSEGHKIQGTNGIEIFANSKDTKNDFKIYSGMITNIMNGVLAGTYLGEWKHGDYSLHRNIQSQHQWTVDYCVQQQVMHEDPTAFKITSSISETESEEEVHDEVTVEKRPAPDDGQEQRQAKRVRNAVDFAGDPSEKLVMFTEKIMENQRKDAEDNAELRVKLAEMTYTAKTLAERLQRSEDYAFEMETRFKNSDMRCLNMELRHQEAEAVYIKAVDEFTKTIEESEKKYGDIVEKHRESEKKVEDFLISVHETLGKAEEMIVGLSQASEGLVEERVNHATLKGRVFDVIGDVLNALAEIKVDYEKTVHELDSAKKSSARDLEIRKYMKEEWTTCEAKLLEYKAKYDGPEWKNLTAFVEQLEVENRTLRAVMRARNILPSSNGRQ